MTFGRLVDDLLTALFPATCPCGAHDGPCCDACIAALRTAPAAAPPAGIDWWIAPFAYEGTARELVARAKYRNARTSIEWFAAAIAACLPDASGVDVVTWAPASRARRRANGLDHGETLARAVAREVSLPAAPLLVRESGPAQTGAAHHDRTRGPVLRACGCVATRSVLVVDDVATTGATLTAAARALRSAGARAVAAATATRTPRPGQP